VPVTAAVGILDPLATRVLAQYPYRFTVPTKAEDRAVAYQIRYEAVRESGWQPAEALSDGLERDAYDEHAIQVLGWDDETPVCTGRLVVPPHPLPTQDACGIVVAPAGRVVDVGRMCVVKSRQTHRHAVFIALLCRLYLEMRAHGYEVACGMMTPAARTLVGQLGVRIDVIGEDRPYWGEDRAPVRFELTANAGSLNRRWSNNA
jgi:hypothetical protein